MSLPDGQLEWLETNPLGSFCFACVDRKLRRKYHALLTVRDPGRGDPWNLLAETRETLNFADQSVTLADPLGDRDPNSELVAFGNDPHATHRYVVSLAQNVEVERSVRLAARDQVEIRYRLRNVPASSDAPLRLIIEPLLRCRPLHELTQENPFLDGTCVKLGDEVRLLPYAGMPAIALRVYGGPISLARETTRFDATFEEQGQWFTANYPWEAARGYEANESLFSPGRFSIALSHDAELTFVVGLHRVEPPAAARPLAAEARESVHEARNEPLAQACSHFFAESSQHEPGLIAGYPWFSLRSRDALLALPGVYLATGSWPSVERVLAHLAKARVRGLIAKSPGFAGLSADTPSVEASLLFARTVQWFAAELGEEQVSAFMPVVCELLESLAEGSDPRVRFDRGVSIYCELGPHALTWMDASIDGAPLTPRAGYAVDLDALSYNAVHFACAWADSKRPGFARTFRNRLRNAEGEFVRRYWDDARGYLADTHDGEQADTRLRPNQLWALALPHRPLSNAMAQAVWQAVTRDLWTPLGLRTLSPQAPDYQGSYGGDQAQRDRAYHQGSVWPSLTGIYADATLATCGRAALAEHVAPILARIGEHLQNEGCIGHVSELFDGTAPHRAGGAPVSLASAAELYRSQRLLADSATRPASSGSELRPKLDSVSAPKRVAHSNQHSRETLSK